MDLKEIAKIIKEAAEEEERKCTDVGATPFRDKVNEMVCNLELNKEETEKIKEIIYRGE